MKRREFILGLGAAVTLPVAAGADEQPLIVAASLLCERFHTSCVFV